VLVFYNHKQTKMKGVFLAIYLFSLWLVHTTGAQAQQVDSKDTPPGPALRRAQQIIAISSSKEPDAAAKLKDALADESWYVRGSAARAFGRLGDKSASSLLLPLLQDNSWFVRLAALEALSALRPSGASVSGTSPDLSSLRDALASPDEYVRARAAVTSPAAGNAAVELLVKLLSDPEPLVRRSAVQSLGELKATSAVDALTPLLKDDDQSTRKTAAIALGRIGDKKVSSALETAAASNDDQWEYAAALYRLGNRDHLSQVTDALRNEYADVRRQALKALLEFGDNRALPALLALANDDGAIKRGESPWIRLALAEGLVHFDGDEPRIALISLLGDSEAAVRAASAASLVKISTPDPKSEASQRLLIALIGALKKETVPIVITAITDGLSIFDRSRVADLLLDARTPEGKLSPTILGVLAASGVTAESETSQLTAGNAAEQIRAAERLSRLGDPRAVAPLIDALTGAKELQVRVKSAEALGALRDRHAVEPLIGASHASEAQLRTAAVTALGLIGDHVAAEALFIAVRDSEPAVREAGLHALAAFGISVERVSSDLSSSNWQVRAAAVTTLARLGDRGAVPPIVSALKDSDSRVRSEAARALGTFNDQSATDALIGALHDQSADVRVEATFSLGRLKDSRALSPLTLLLTDGDSRVSLAAAESLARLQDPRATRVLIDSLLSADWRVRSRATQVLARIAGEGMLDSAVGPLTIALADKDPVVRYYAAEALVGIGAKAIPSLIQALRSHRQSDCDRAARVLWSIGPAAVDPLLGVLQDRTATPEMRTASASALGMIGDPRAIRGLALLLRDERYFVREQASRALGRIGEPAVSLLLEMANSSTPTTREAAVAALGNTGSKHAIEKVIEALSDSNANVRSAAVRSLGESASQMAVSHLMALLRDESSALRAQAAASLGRLGHLSLPSLVSALKDPKPSVRQLAAEALGDIGSKDAVAPLIELIASDQSGARPEAIEALGKIGDPAAVGTILSVMRTGSPSVRKRAISALSSFRDSRVIDALAAALSDQNEEVRQAAAAGLGEVGDERVIARLERLADNDSSADVRTAAAQAIQRIRQDQKPIARPEQQKPSRP
jgi:HEAT repeat protein